MALVQTVRGHRGEVSCVDLTWGGLLATGGGDRTVRLWRWGGSGFLEEGATSRHRLGVTVVKFSPYGAALASAGLEGAVRVWRVAGGRGARSWRDLPVPGGASVRALVWVAGWGADVVASGGDGGDVCVWGVRRGVLLRRLAAREEAGGVTALVTACGGSLLVAALTGGGLAVWTVTGEEEAHLTDGAHDMGSLCASWLQGRELLATGGQDATVRLWKVREGGALHLAGVLEGHSSAVTGVCWLQGGNGSEELASCSLDRSVRVWHVGEGAGSVLGIHTRYVTSLACCPSGTLLVSSSNDRSVRVWSLQGRYPEVLTPPCPALDHFGVGDLQGIEQPPNDLPDTGPARATASEGRCVSCVWSDRDTHEAAINSVYTWGQLLVTACSDSAVRVWEWDAGGAVDGRLIHTLLAHHYPATSALLLPPHGTALLSVGLDGQLLLWDLQSGSRTGGATYASGSVCAGGGGLRGLAVSPSSPHLVLTASDDQVAPLWKLNGCALSVEHVYEGYDDGVWCCAWSPDGRVAVTGGAGGELRMYSPPPDPALLLLRYNAHDLGVQCCDFAPLEVAGVAESGEEVDSDYRLATGGCDSTGRLWRLSVSTGGEGGGREVKLELLHELHGHGGTVTCCCYSRRGVLLATGATDHHVRLWSRSGSCVHTVTLRAGVGGVAFWAGEDGANEERLAVGALNGELSVWSVPGAEDGEEAGIGDESDDGEGSGLRGSDEGAVQGWAERRVAGWLREHVTRSPEAGEARQLEMRLTSRVVERGVRGERLLDGPVDDLLPNLGVDEPKSWCGYLVRRELWWLRAGARLPPSAAQCNVPHALRCPLTHAPLLVAAAGGDGRTYERAALREWLQLAGGRWPSLPRSPPPARPRLPLNHSAISAARAALLSTLGDLLPPHPPLPAFPERPPHTYT